MGNFSILNNLLMSNCNFACEQSQDIDSRLSEFFLSMKAFTNLKKLHLADNLLFLDKERELQNYIKSDRHLKELDLRDSKIGDNAAIGIFKGLQRNTALKVLNISGCNLTDVAGLSLCEYFFYEEAQQTKLTRFKRHQSLKELDVSFNSFTDETGIPLAYNLHDNKSLQSLNLKGNDLMEAAGTAFVKILEFNNCLALLNLDCNQV